MMARTFRPPKRVYLLDFEGTDLDGLEVRTTAPPLSLFLELSRLDAGSGEEALQAMADGFLRHVRSWNLETEEGEPAALTSEVLLSEGIDFTLRVITTWMTAVTDVVGPLAQPSTGGETFPEASLPMVPLSRNRAS